MGMLPTCPQDARADTLWDGARGRNCLRLIPPNVLDFLPVGVKRRRVEVWVVVEVVAGDAVRFFGVSQRQADLLISRVLFAGFDQLNVSAAGAVTVLAAVVEKLLGFLFALEAAVVPQDLLRMPTGCVTGEAFGIMNSRDPAVLQLGPAFDQTVVGVRVVGFFPDSECFGMTFRTGLCADELGAAGVLDRRFSLGEHSLSTSPGTDACARPFFASLENAPPSA